MTVLIDTHALLWWFDGDAKLSRTARSTILSDDVLVSAASVWEIATKARLGKLPKALPIARRLEEAVAAHGFTILPISGSHANRAGWLAGRHGDPFDRMLVAQALEHGIAIVTTDRMLSALGATILW